MNNAQHTPDMPPEMPAEYYSALEGTVVSFPGSSKDSARAPKQKLKTKSKPTTRWPAVSGTGAPIANKRENLEFVVGEMGLSFRRDLFYRRDFVRFPDGHEEEITDAVLRDIYWKVQGEVIDGITVAPQGDSIHRI